MFASKEWVKDLLTKVLKKRAATITNLSVGSSTQSFTANVAKDLTTTVSLSAGTYIMTAIPIIETGQNNSRIQDFYVILNNKPTTRFYSGNYSISTITDAFQLTEDVTDYVIGIRVIPGFSGTTYCTFTIKLVKVG